MLDDLVRERDEARAEVARLRAMLAESAVIARPGADTPPNESDPDLASQPSYGIIALACERARQEAVAEALAAD